MRQLIVNADDFGLSAGINRGIIEAHEHGILTSASLMVRAAAAAEAAAYARTHPTLSVGLHVDLCEWIFRDGAWAVLYEVVPMTSAEAVAAEVQRQLALFRELTGREPSHLDSHQHVHRDEPLRSLLLGEAGRRGVVLRHLAPEVHYCGEFYGQSDKGYPYPEGIRVEALERILSRLPAGTTELACHPGYAEGLTSAYGPERAVEVKTLCDGRIRAAIDSGRIRLISFGPVHSLHR